MQGPGLLFIYYWLEKEFIIETSLHCPDCGAIWHDGQTCQDCFHLMGVWEFEDPEHRWEVHHLMVLCYHLQHPHLYSPEGLTSGIKLLDEFVGQNVSPQTIRARNNKALGSDKRNWKIKGTATSYGKYQHPISWTMTATDVIARGVDAYCDSVRLWAQSIHAAITTSGNFPS